MTEWTLVTGGAKGLGSATCKSLAKKGHSIVCHYKESKKEAELLVQELQQYGVEAESIQGDFSKKETLQAFVARYKRAFPKTRFLINNVGNYLIKDAAESTMQEVEALFQTNVEAPLYLIQELLQTLKSVVNIGTCGLQTVRADTHSPLYKSSKMALYSLTKSLARELAGREISVNMVSPGYLNYSVDLPQDVTKLPMKRAATPEEVARVVAFLLEEESRYITGQNIDVAGGIGL